jgi:hypothetical protein
LQNLEIIDGVDKFFTDMANVSTKGHPVLYFNAIGFSGTHCIPSLKLVLPLVCLLGGKN